MTEAWVKLSPSSSNALCKLLRAAIFVKPDSYWLVVLTILKNMKVNGKDYPIYYGRKCLKPPTSGLSGIPSNRLDTITPTIINGVSQPPEHKIPLSFHLILVGL